MSAARTAPLHSKAEPAQSGRVTDIIYNYKPKPLKINR